MADLSKPRVTVLDLLCVVPSYDVRLVSALRLSNPNVQLVAASPHRSPRFFGRHGLDTRAPIIDWVARAPAAVLGNVRIRRTAKAVEYHLNLVVLGVRLLLNAPDVVHSQWMPMLGRSPIDLWFVKFVKRRDIPFVHTVHNVLPHDDDTERTRSAYAALYSLSTLLICHTREARRRLVGEFNLASERVVMIPHGPLGGATAGLQQDESFGIARVDPASRIVLSLGVIRPYKGLEDLLCSWKLVRFPDAKLVIAGGGEPAYVRKLRDFANNLDLGDTVDLRLEYVSDAEHDALHRVADVVVLPYKEINQSGALMTAMAYGRAIVATDVGGFGEVIESGRNGIIVPRDDAEALASAIRFLLENDDQRRDLGSAAEADTRTVLSWESIAGKTAGCYVKAIRLNDDKNSK